MLSQQFRVRKCPIGTRSFFDETFLELLRNIVEETWNSLPREQRDSKDNMVTRVMGYAERGEQVHAKLRVAGLLLLPPHALKFPVIGLHIHEPTGRFIALGGVSLTYYFGLHLRTLFHGTLAGVVASRFVDGHLCLRD